MHGAAVCPHHVWPCSADSMHIVLHHKQTAGLCLLHPFSFLLLKCAPSQHRDNLQQIIYQMLTAACSAWQILLHFSVAAV